MNQQTTTPVKVLKITAISRNFAYVIVAIFSLFLNLTFAQNGFSAIAPDVLSMTSISSGLNTPVRLTTDPAGFIYVSDPRNRGILQLDNNGIIQSKIATNSTVLGIAVASNGHILASQGTAVSVYSGATKIQDLGTFGAANGIAVAADGTIFVVDSKNNNVQIFNSDYSPRSNFGTFGMANGQFRQPTGIAYEKISDQIAIADTQNGRIQFFSKTGVFQRSIGSYGAGPLKFTSPQGVSFEYTPDGSTLKRIYVVDAFQSNVQVIEPPTATSATDTFIRYIGNYGIIQGKLITPSDILFDKNSRLLVANGTGKLSLFAIADPSSSPLLFFDTIPQATNLSSITLSGSTTGTSVTVNGVPAFLNGSSWSKAVTLSVGSNLFTVVASNANGSTSKTATITASNPTNNPVVLAVEPLPTQTATPSITVKGTTTSGASVTVNGTQATVSGTSWSANITLQSGTNPIKIIASKTGMDNSTVDISITLDTTVPTIATRLPSSGSVFATPLQNISGTVSSANAANVLLTLNGTTATLPVTDGTFSIPIILESGNNSISIKIVDSNGTSSQTLQTSVTYNPQAPRVTITTPAGSVSNTQSYTLSGVAPIGSSVSVNGTPAIVNGTAWSATVVLQQGINGFEINATLTDGSATTATTSIAYSPNIPAFSITSPPSDVAVASPIYTLSGVAPAGSIITARVNGVSATVTSSPNGQFSVSIPDMTATGKATAVISVTDPTSGSTSSITRSFVYESAPPRVTVVSESPLKVSSPAGTILIAKDKNGIVGTVTNNTLDLTNVSYDPATLNIQALSAAGLSSRNGDINNDGKVDIADALQALRASAKLDTITISQSLSGDVAPLVNFESQPDGVIGLDDAIVILNKLLGLIP